MASLGSVTWKGSFPTQLHGQVRRGSSSSSSSSSLFSTDSDQSGNSSDLSTGAAGPSALKTKWRDPRLRAKVAAAGEFNRLRANVQQAEQIRGAYRDKRRSELTSPIRRRPSALRGSDPVFRLSGNLTAADQAVNALQAYVKTVHGDAKKEIIASIKKAGGHEAYLRRQVDAEAKYKNGMGTDPSNFIARYGNKEVSAQQFERIAATLKELTADAIVFNKYNDPKAVGDFVKEAIKHSPKKVAAAIKQPEAVLKDRVESGELSAEDEAAILKVLSDDLKREPRSSASTARIAQIEDLEGQVHDADIYRNNCHFRSFLSMTSGLSSARSRVETLVQAYLEAPAEEGSVEDAAYHLLMAAGTPENLDNYVTKFHDYQAKLADAGEQVVFKVTPGRQSDVGQSFAAIQHAYAKLYTCLGNNTPPELYGELEQFHSYSEVVAIDGGVRRQAIDVERLKTSAPGLVTAMDLSDRPVQLENCLNIHVSEHGECTDLDGISHSQGVLRQTYLRHTKDSPKELVVQIPRLTAQQQQGADARKMHTPVLFDWNQVVRIPATYTEGGMPRLHLYKEARIIGVVAHHGVGFQSGHFQYYANPIVAGGPRMDAETMQRIQRGLAYVVLDVAPELQSTLAEESKEDYDEACAAYYDQGSSTTSSAADGCKASVRSSDPSDIPVASAVAAN